MKKAQVQMIETIGVLVVFMILLVFGFIFYSQVVKTDFEREDNQFTQLESIKVAQKALFLPELKCPLNMEGCVDLFKLMAFKQLVEEHRVFYYDSFKFSTISVDLVYPSPTSAGARVILYDNPLPNGIGKYSTQMPINIYNPIDQSYGFGFLTVDYYLIK